MDIPFLEILGLTWHAGTMKPYLTRSTLSLVGRKGYFWNNIKFAKKELLPIGNSPNNGVKDNPNNQVLGMEIDFPIDYN